MKFPLEWHERGLANSKLNLNDKRLQLARLEEDIFNHKLAIVLTEQQIEEAKRRGLTEFDPDKFLKTRKKA